MEIPKLIILLCCSYYGIASHHVHTIPVENYETELQVLGEHVEIPETPVRVVKITKTVAVKIPVPYPVKVIEKVPYPVHINKPYPVPVPQIVKVPHVESPPKVHGHEALGSQGGSQNFHGHHSGGQDNTYQVQEGHPDDRSSNGDSYGPEIQSYNGDNSGHSQGFAPYSDEYSSEASPGHSYEAPSHSYYGNTGGSDAESFESKNYDQAIRNYLHKFNPNGDTAGLKTYNYH